MRIAVTGTRGTLGIALARQIKARADDLLELNRPEVDITDPAAVFAAFESVKPEVLIHPAAYTNVDGAESNADEAFRVNGLGTRNLALACERAGISIVYVSTNMVFD